MDLRAGDVMIPVSAINIFNNITILALVPIFENYMYPFIKRVRGYPLTMLEKIGYGFFLAMLAMLVAGLIEGKCSCSCSVVVV